MFYKKHICKMIGHNFDRYEKVKEDNYLEYRESYCKRCWKKDLYLEPIY